MDKIKFWVTIFLFLASPSLYALTTLHVSTPTDNNPGGRGDPGDLRFCLNSMNEDLQTISDDYAIVFDFPMTIQLNGILPIINSSANSVNITIGNPGSIATVTIDGNAGAYSGFFIPMGNVTIQNINFKDMTAKGGNGGDGISGGGGGLGAGGAIYVPQNFLYGSNPSVTLMNVSITNCSAVGGNGGNYLTISSPTGNEGGGGGGGFSGNGGSITTVGVTGGAGGGGFGGNGGDVTQSTSGTDGGGGGGGGGIGSRATLGILTNLGNGGSDQDIGQNGNGFGLSITAGAGGGGKSGGIFAGGGGGGGDAVSPGGGGGGSAGQDGLPPQGSTPAWAPTVQKSPTLMGGLIRQSVNQPAGKSVSQIVDEINVLFSKFNGKNTPFHKTLPPTKAKVNQKLLALHVKAFFASALPSGGDGGSGGGAGGGGVVKFAVVQNNTDGHSGNGGYGGGGGGGAGTGAYDTDYTVIGGDGGIGGGGGGGGVNQSGMTSANGGNSQGGGGGGGGGPSNGLTASGGSDLGNLGGGSGGSGDSTVGLGFGGGGGGGGSGLGGAIFIDSGLNFTIQALSGIPTVFNTINNTTQSGHHGNGATSAFDGQDGTALGNSIFLRNNSSLSLVAQDANDILTLGDQVSFTDDTNFGIGGTLVLVKGNGTVIYNGTTNYQGIIRINNANFKVNGEIDNASILVCRDNIASQRGILSGSGILTGTVFANSGSISPDIGAVLTLGSLELHSAVGSSLGSLVHTDINSTGTSSVAVNGTADLAGILEVKLASDAVAGQYILLTSANIVGTFDAINVTSDTGKTPNYTLSYLPAGAPTFVQLNFTGFVSSSVNIPATVNGASIFNPSIVCCGRPVILGPLPVPGTGPTTYTVTQTTGNVTCHIGQTSSQTYLKMEGKNGSCTIVGTKEGVTSNPLTVTV